MKQLTIEEVRWELRKHIATKYGTQKDAAKALDMSQSFLSRVLRGGAVPTVTILDDAGFDRVESVKYVRKPKGEA